MKKTWLSFLLIFSISFVSIYLAMSVAVWLFSNVEMYSGRTSALKNYVQNHPQDIKKGVFETIFADSLKCRDLTNQTLKEACQKLVSRKLAVLLKEEELKIYDSDWPNDLFFVKHDDDKYLLLGWSGEIKDISAIVDKKLLASSTPFLFKILTHNCDFFNFDDMNNECSTFVRVPLSHSMQGYMIRYVPFKEEMDLLTLVVIPFGVFFDLLPYTAIYMGIPTVIALIIAYFKTRKEYRKSI